MLSQPYIEKIDYCVKIIIKKMCKNIAVLVNYVDETDFKYFLSITYRNVLLHKNDYKIKTVLLTDLN